MARKPIWQDPDIRRNHNETAREEIGALLQARNLVHLDVYSRGDHVVIHSFDQGEKISRIRFTRIGMDRDGDRYELGIASHTGGWQPTPCTGSIPELFGVVSDQFPWVLEDY